VECETVPVTYVLKVSITGVSGEQEWGPFCSKASAEAAVVALAGRENVFKVVIEKKAVL
jgi:hypothetical protein